jgi:hypothetical protein
MPVDPDFKDVMFDRKSRTIVTSYNPRFKKEEVTLTICINAKCPLYITCQRASLNVNKRLGKYQSYFSPKYTKRGCEYYIAPA